MLEDVTRSVLNCGSHDVLQLYFRNVIQAWIHFRSLSPVQQEYAKPECSAPAARLPAPSSVLLHQPV